MNETKIYKISDAKVSKSKNGFTIYNFLLNNKIWASKLAPLRKSEKKYNKLYKICQESDGTFEPIIGNYILASISQNQYGYQVDCIDSFDAISYFKSLLDENQGKPFTTYTAIYEFLKDMDRSIEQDNSIKLKEPYQYYHILLKDGCAVCLIKESLQKDNVLNFDNLNPIFEEFYKGKDTGGSIDTITSYSLSSEAIKEVGYRSHKTTGKNIRNIERVVIQIGDTLSDRQIAFLNA